MNLRRFFLVAALAAVAAIIVLNFGHIEQFAHLVRSIRWYVLVLVIVVQGLDYFANAKYYQEFLRLFGYEVDLRRLYEAALTINFVNQVFPSGGVSGAGFLAADLSPEVPAGKATLAQLMRYAFTYLSFILVLMLGFLMLFLGNDVSRVTVRLILLLILAIIVVSVVVLAVISDRPRTERAAEVVVGTINRFWRLVHQPKRQIEPESLTRFLDEFYHGYELLMEDKARWKKPLIYSLAANFAEVATVYAVFLAFSRVVNPGVVIAAYTLANIFSLMAVVSSGLGVYEGAMVAAFVALGVPFALSLSVVLVYRIFNLLFFLPLGFLTYRKSLERRPAQ